LNKLSLLLNFLLIPAVAFLYYKQLSGPDEPIAITGQAAQSRIVFVNSDSLMDNYDLFTDMQNRMEARRDSLDRVLTAKGAALEKEISDYQEKGAGMSAAERQLREEALMRKQQAIMKERDDLLEVLKEEESALTDSIYTDLMDYLKEFNRNKGYDFILGYTRGGGILLANDSLEITRQVISGLNKK